MSDPTANRTLELACTVGSLDDALEAIEEGADVNHNHGAPLFLSIVNRHRTLIALLLERGADAVPYLPKKKARVAMPRDELVEELIAAAPYDPRDVKREQIEEIDSGIRDEGVGFLVTRLEWDSATRFRDALNAIGAGSRHRCVAEFLQWVRSENGFERESVHAFLNQNEGAISEYRERYIAADEDLIALVNEYCESGS